ncbi:hypothetical protein EJB05_23459 [Eragrostis curvula]|uniref:Enoyl-CoA hydratase/isomerase domain-containing protein n=1 Tax=Eragrostis curvula TaxID=38414 RepID=A0A5J9V6J7_9POAL|nr:hypothetical protein EJB05_23459 [Eragrostis curvula]
MSVNGISKQFSHEFCEGVRARLVDKDLAPKWDPPALEYVSRTWWTRTLHLLASLIPS